jgi:hypothetical protein
MARWEVGERGRRGLHDVGAEAGALRECSARLLGRGSPPHIDKPKEHPLHKTWFKRGDFE